MRRRFVVFVAGALLATLGLTAGLLRKGPAAGSSLPIAAPAVGREVVLHVVWHERSTLRMPEGAESDGTLSGELDLEANLALSGEKTTDGGDAIRAELRDVRSSRLVVGGHEVLGSTEATRHDLEGRPVHLVVEAGRIVRVLVDRDAASLAVQLTENAARQVLITTPRPETETFERVEELPAGTLRVRYQRRGIAYERTLLGAETLTGLPDRCEGKCTLHASGHGSVELDAAGVVVRFEDEHHLRAASGGAAAMFDATASFVARRAQEAEVAPSTVDGDKLAAKLPGEIFESDADKRASLDRLAAGTTIDDVLGGLAAASASGATGAPKGWLVRGAAFLELHPEALKEVAVRFEDDGLSSGGKTAILDLLAATGGDAAKSALLGVLDSDAARQDRERITLVQRALLVDEPNAEMARSFRDRFTTSQASGDHEMAYAEAHVLGAMAGRLAARGERARAKSAVDLLAGALDKAEAPAPRAAFISALGNAADPTQVARITGFARDTDPTVRRSVASALRKTSDRSSRRTLVGLAGDADEEVQVAAVDALTHHPIDEEEERGLVQLLDGAKLGQESEGQLVTALLGKGPPSPMLRASLEHVAERSSDPRLTARILLAFEASKPSGPSL